MSIKVFGVGAENKPLIMPLFICCYFLFDPPLPILGQGDTAHDTSDIVSILRISLLAHAGLFRTSLDYPIFVRLQTRLWKIFTFINGRSMAIRCNLWFGLMDGKLN